MTSIIWNKYKVIKEIDKNLNIKTYLTRIEPIIKEIIPKNNNEYFQIKERLESLKNIIKIYDIIEEDDKLYIVIENEKEGLLKFDKLIKDEFNVEKEGILEGHGNPVTKNEILNLFEMEKSMCKIIFEKIENNEIKKGKGSGFFCEIDNFPIKYALFTNNHVLDENNLQKGCIINIEYKDKKKIIKKKIKINEERKVYTNKDMDYTCIEILKTDGIKEFFKIDRILFSDNKNCLKNTDIFILQYPKGNELSFSYGKILSIKGEKIIHSAATEHGSSGSPIIRRNDEYCIIGLHYGGIKKDNKYSFNLATEFNSILKDINKPNEINCVYFNKKGEITLLNDYNCGYTVDDDFVDFDEETEEEKKFYSEEIKKNNELLKENVDLYINGVKNKFDFEYKANDSD